MTKYDEIMKEVNLTPEARDRIIENICAEMDKGVKAAPRRRRNTWKYLTTAACCVLVIFGAIAASKSGLISYVTDGSDSMQDTGKPSVELQADGEDMEGSGSAGSQEQVTDPENSYSEGEGSETVDGDVLTDDQKTELAGNSSKNFSVDGNIDYNEGAVNPVTSFDSLEELSDFVGFEVDPGSFEKFCLDSGLTDVEYTAYDDDLAEVSYTDGEITNYFRMSKEGDDISGDYNEYSLLAEFDGIESSGSLSGNKGKYMLAEWVSKDGFNYAAYIEKGLTDTEWLRIINNTEEGDKR